MTLSLGLSGQQMFVASLFNNNVGPWNALSLSLQVPLALLQGRVSHILWPPQRVGRVESRPPDASRVLLKRSGIIRVRGVTSR
jgi:hypothetical protein